jgi:hypothetical protein
MVASLLDARATLVHPPQRHQVLVLVVPLAANNGMGLHEFGVIDRALALGEIHIRLEGVKGEVADTFGPLRIPVAGAFHGLQHRDRGILRGRGQVGIEGVVKVRNLLQAALHQLPSLLGRDGLVTLDRRPDTVQGLAKHASITPAGGLGEPGIGRQEPLTAQRGKADPSRRGQPLELALSCSSSIAHTATIGELGATSAVPPPPATAAAALGHHLADSSDRKATRSLRTFGGVEPA